jgi:branched-chain amino acid transport system substrate-binding protein
MRLGLAAVGVTTLMASVLSGVVTAGPAAAATATQGITKTTIKIGIISDLTGAAASTFGDSPQAIEARFKQINAAGGINGRKITWVVADTQSSPTGAETAAKDLIESQGVYAIAEVSALLFAAAPYLNQGGIPVVGSSRDGPEWYEPPNTNMFNVSGNDSPSEPGYTDGGFWKAVGATKISFIASNTPSSTRGTNPFIADMKADGLAACDNTVVPLGAVNFTTYALSFKNDGCNAAECSCVLSSSLALSTALTESGLKAKVVYAAGPSTQIFENAEDEAAANGAYFVGTTYSDAAGKAFLASLKKYDPLFKGGLPDLGAEYGWEVGNLAVLGLQDAGKNPTRPSFITNLRKVTSWTDSGLAPAPINLKDFGQAPKTECGNYVQFVNKKYVPFPRNGSAFCGKIIPGSGTPT